MPIKHVIVDDEKTKAYGAEEANGRDKFQKMCGVPWCEKNHDTDATANAVRFMPRFTVNSHQAKHQPVKPYQVPGTWYTL